MKKNGERARGPRDRSSGFSLVEVVLALAIIAVTFIGLIGLLGIGVANDQTSSEQTVANNIAASILADLRSTPTYSTTSSRYNLTLPTSRANAGNPIGTSTTPLSGLNPIVLYFNNTAVFIPPINSSPPPASAAYVANVYLTRAAFLGPSATSSTTQSNDMVRVVVSWPAQTTTAPAGSVDFISQFVIH
jgi:prepilin-type N-terminal cleavage/methylation domain-containing protein